jgi:membrane fusion protein, multidrug efflux system
MSAEAPTRRKRGRTLPVLIVLALIAGGGWYGWTRLHKPEAAPVAAREPEAVPVGLATVDQGTFAEVLGSLGTAQAFNTVQVRTRVDGEITQVAFREGQIVRKGDLLVQVDPRPFLATLDAAKAKKAQDEANLKNVKADVERSTA